MEEQLNLQDVNPEDADVLDGSAPSEETQEELETQTEKSGEEITEEITEDEELKPEDVLVKGKKQPLSRVQKRINQLTREKYELKARLEALERQLLEKELKDIPSEKPRRPSLEDVNYDAEAYQKALDHYEEQLAKWQQAQLRQQLLQQQQQQMLMSKIQMKIEEGLRKYPDFQEVALNPYVPYSEAMRQAVIESEKAADIAYYLGKNLAEAARIASLPPYQAMREIAALELKLSMKPQKKVISSAPNPINPVSGNDVVQKDPTKMSIDEWMKWRRNQIKKGG